MAHEPIVRLILDGTVVRVRLDRKATSILLLVVIGVRDDGQKLHAPVCQPVVIVTVSTNRHWQASDRLFPTNPEILP